MNRFALTTLCFLLCPIPSVRSSEIAGPASDVEESDYWTRSRETADDWWRGSRQAAEDAWRETQDAADAAWEDTRKLFTPQKEGQFGEVWNRVLPKLEETLTLEERHRELPVSAWLGPDQESNQTDINELLDEAVEILSIASVQGYRERIRILQTTVETARGEIADYRQRQVSAPVESMVKKTVADYDNAIQGLRTDIRRYEQELAEVKREFAVALRGMGLELSDDQVDLLLATVVGDNLIDLGIVFDNVKAITLQLERLVEGSGEDLPSARRYYGMYVVLLKSLGQMHLQVERAVGGQYIPQIDTIIARAQGLKAETRALQERSPDKAELLATNLEAQQLTIQAAGVYRRYLTEQAQLVADARMDLEKDIAAAWNTYETVRVSGDLVDLVKSSNRLLEGLLDRQVPTLRPFQNLEMKREFEKLTEQLRSAQTS